MLGHSDDLQPLHDDHPPSQLVLSPATAHTSLGNVNQRSRSEGNTNPSPSKLVSLDHPAELSSS